MPNTEKIKSGIKKITLATILALTPVMCGSNSETFSQERGPSRIEQRMEHRMNSSGDGFMGKPNHHPNYAIHPEQFHRGQQFVYDRVFFSFQYYDPRTRASLFYYNNEYGSRMMLWMNINDPRWRYFTPWSTTPTHQERLYNALERVR